MSSDVQKTGVIQNYVAEKGFGFIKPDGGSENIFFHIHKWMSKSSPEKGMLVKYHVGVDKSGRPCAVKVEPA